MHNPPTIADSDLSRRAQTWGKVRFTATDIATSARTEGDISAWKQLLDRGGPSALEATSGAFAVALDLSPSRTFLAVDRFAIQPLCWRLIQGRLHFAERADTLAAMEPKAAVEPQAIFDYLYFHVIPAPRTIFKGVHRLPAGHYALCDQGRVTVAPYWVPSFQSPKVSNFQELTAEFRTLLRDAVVDQLDGSKAACFLSGGTDSSTVAGMIREATGHPAATYSIGFEAEGYDEMAFARLAAKHFGADHHEYYVTPDDLVETIPLVAGHYDQPFGNSSVLPAYHCARMAREDGATRLLAGDGGDELFGGNVRYATQRVFGLYGSAPQLLRAGVLEPLLLHTPVGGLPLARKGRSYIQQAKVPLPDRMQTYNQLGRLGLNAVLTPDFLARIDITSPLDQQRQVWQQAQCDDDLNRMLAFDWRYTLAEADLPKVCGSAALAGVGVGFPLLNHRLVDFSMRLPVSYKLKGLKLRWFFKEALRGFLPDEILTKKKQGFGLPFGVWATRHEGLRRFATDTLHSLAERGIVRADFIRTLLGDHLRAHPGYFGEMVWILMMLEQWLQRHAPDHQMG